MQTKAQIQITETIAVLFVFFMLIVVGFIFYVNIIKGNIELEKEELSQLRSIGIAQRIMFLPELQCTEDNVITDNCIDLLKLESANSIMRENELYYYDLLEFSEVNVTQIYPAESKFTVYSRKLDNAKSSLLTPVPISLYDPLTKKYSFGVLSIETQSK